MVDLVNHILLSWARTHTGGSRCWTRSSRTGSSSTERGSPASAGRRRDRATGASWRSATSTSPPRRTIDADGQVVAPGFVDVHTHLDAQVFWDPTLEPVAPPRCDHDHRRATAASRIAPLTEAAGDYLMRMLARVEGMPLESLEAGVPWDWTHDGRVPRPARRHAGDQRRLHGRPLGAAARGDGRGRHRARRPTPRRARGHGAAAARRPRRRRRSASRRRGPRRTTTPTATRCRRATPTADELVALAARVRRLRRARRSSSSRRRPGAFGDEVAELMVAMSAAARPAAQLERDAAAPPSNLDECARQQLGGQRPGPSSGGEGRRRSPCRSHAGPVLLPHRVRARRPAGLGRA